MEKPARDEVLNRCREFAMMLKLSGKRSWVGLGKEGLKEAIKYELDVVQKYFPDENNEIWAESLKSIK